MGDKDEPLNDTPEMRDALRSIEAIGEDQTGVEDAPEGTGPTRPTPHNPSE
jgi:hypothetical protein